ncbi:MAG: acetoin utilization protein AcuC [Actinobacteria bacterium]|nr:acetoin utilization protein AcuC [Actinomycetota bacterium]
MTGAATILWNEQLRQYDFGPDHPLSPIRVQLAMRLVEDYGLLDHPQVTISADTPILDDATLERVHRPDYVAAVKRASQPDADANAEARYGLGTADTPIFENMHAASARIAGASLTGAREVLEGRARHSVNLSGGLHHAMPDRASGFCVYNDAAVAIAWLLDQGLERVVYIDVDVHHGDGVQAAFWDDPRVMTISIHESPATLFPGTGWPTEIGGPTALGSKVNIALPAGTGDQGWLRGLHAVAPALIESFKPQFIVSQHGCDGHFEDPLASMALSIDGLRMAAEAIHAWSHRYAGGKWLALGGGGYEWVDVVPRAWANVIAIASGEPINPKTEIPDSFREYVKESMGRVAPYRMTDGYEPWPKAWDLGYNPADPVDSAINATRNAVFPYNGLVPDSFGGF